MGGAKALINDYQNGILTEVGNIDMLAEKIEELLTNSDLALKLGKNAINIKKVLSPSKINKKWEKYIHNVCNIK